ncbi:MAG: signal peptidase I [Acidobacteriota bacterium]|nr:signal peptidase I [Acidobacteriota bacterium]
MRGAKGAARIYLEALVLTVLLASFVRVFLVQGVRISSGSMEPTLLIGDHLLVNRLVARADSGALARLLPSRTIRRGDLLLHRDPVNPATLLVKRCIGLPGERIELRGGAIRIDGAPISTTAFGSTPTGDAPLSRVIPDGHYFVLGDRRERSLDSRGWGAVPSELILGRPFFSYWSWRATADRDSGTIEKSLDLVTRFVSGTRWDRTGRPVR